MSGLDLMGSHMDWLKRVRAGRTAAGLVRGETYPKPGTPLAGMDNLACMSDWMRRLRAGRS
jgi:hypothetical protein